MKKDKYNLFATRLDDASKHPDKRMSVSPEEMAEYEKLVFLWKECSLPEIEESKAAIWSKTQRKIAEESGSDIAATKGGNRIRRFHIWKYALAAASSVALLLGIAHFYQPDERRNNLHEIARSLQSEVPQNVKEVTLVISDTKKIELNNNAKIEYSASGQVQVNSNNLEEAKTDGTYNQIIVPKGRRSQIILADNSKIWINSGTKVIYPLSFKGKYREIYVEGEVYLNVSHNSEKPFIVNTPEFEVRVLGTSFNLSAYKEDINADVVLVEGSVDIKDRNDRHLKLEPNEKAELDQTGITGKQKVDVSDYISWINSVWMLEGETLKDVLERLQDYYGQAIRCSSSVENEMIYGKLFLNNDLEQVVKALMTTLPIQYTMKNNVIYVEHI